MAEFLIVHSTDANLYVYDEAGTLLTTVAVTGYPAGGNLPKITSYGSMVAIASATGVLVLDSADWSTVAEFVALAGSITGIKWSPDGQYIAVSTNNSPIGIILITCADWSVTSQTFSNTRNVAWADDSSAIAITRFDRTTKIAIPALTEIATRVHDSGFAYAAGALIFDGADRTVSCSSSSFARYSFVDSSRAISFGNVGTPRAVIRDPATGYLVWVGTGSPFARYQPVAPSSWGSSAGSTAAPIALPGGNPPDDAYDIAANSDGSRIAIAHLAGDGVTMYEGLLGSKVTLSASVAGVAQGVAWVTAAGSAEYTIAPDTTTADEGDTVTFDITAPTDDDLYYQITGDITADDIASGTLTGTITITAGVGSLAVELLEDGTLEGAEEFAVELYTDSGLTELVATSATVTVADTSTAKVYSIAHDATPAVVSEGAVVTYTLTTEGVVDGSRLWWRCKDTGETETVVVENAAEVEHYTGTITATGASTLTDSAAAWTVDEWAGESVETAGETLVIVSNTTDTLTLAAPWAVEPTGGYRIITPADTTEYSAGSSISSQDTVEGETSFLSEGPIEIVGGTGTFTLTLRSDLITEGSEYIILDIYDEPGSPFGDGEPVATSEPVIVLDTSTSADYVWTGTTFVFGNPVEGETGYASEGATVSVTITASPPPPDGTRLRMQVLGTVDGSDYTITGGSDWVEFDGVSGTVSWGIALDEDVTTEGPETLQIQARTGWPASDGDIVYTSPTITVGDTSQAAPTYAVTPDDTTVNEGDVVVFGVACTTVAPGTILYWTITGDLDAADVVGGALSGAVEIDTGDILASSGHFSITLAEDLTTEGVETFAVEIRTGSIAGPVVATSDTITVADTSVTPPVFSASVSRESVPEGEGFYLSAIADWFLGDTLYITHSGTAGDADFVGGLPETLSLSETTYPRKTGSVLITVAQDELIEGPETISFQLRTGSTGGPIVATAGPVTIIDEAYTLTPDRTLITEGDTVVFTAAAIHSNPSATLYWTVNGTIDTDDVVGGALSGSVTLSGGEGTITITLAVDLISDGAEYFYLELRRGSTSGAILAVSPAVVVRESIIDYDAWLGSLDGVRILLVEMDHSAGTVYFGNYPYTSKPGDTNPNRPYDDTLQDAVDIETRIDGGFTLGEVTVVNDGRHDAWVTYDWHGYPIRFLMGEPGWSLDDFRLVALATNGGLAAVERGLLSFGIYDAKAIFAQPLQTTLLADGNPVPVAVGKPFNVAPPLISVPDDEYQVHEGAIVSVTPRDNGADVASADNLAGGTFELSASPQGTVTADVETSITTPTAIIAWVCDRYGVSVDGDTLDALPAYEIGLFYGSQATGADVLTHVCQSIGGYWLRGADGEVEVYILDEPAETADIELDYQTEIAEGGLRLVAMEEPVKTLTLNYKRNWAPQARDSIAGSVLTGDPAFADALTKEWRQIAVTNAVADHPLAQDAVMDTYLVDSLDAYAEANRVAGLRAVRRERWEVECFLAQASAQVGKTVKITYPGWGFETGRNARIVAVSRQLSRGRVTLEVWL